VARRFDIEMGGITLFIFGGVAEMRDEPPTAWAEFCVAVAGPIASVIIAGACFGLEQAGLAAGWPTPVIGVLWYLWVINAVLVAFNLVPAFPLDGGRVLRSVLWQVKGNLRWATRITSEIGGGFGIVMIVMGVLAFLSGNIVGGVWWFILGMFLRGAAQMSYRQLVVRRALEGESVERFMQRDVHTVPPTTPVDELVDHYVYRYHHKMYPMTDNGDLLGCVHTDRIKSLPRDEWPDRTARDIAASCDDRNTISHRADAMDAMTKMNREGVSRLIVIDDGGHLVGILTLKALMAFLSLKIDLESEEPSATIGTS